MPTKSSYMDTKFTSINYCKHMLPKNVIGFKYKTFLYTWSSTETSPKFFIFWPKCQRSHGIDVKINPYEQTTKNEGGNKGGPESWRGKGDSLICKKGVGVFMCVWCNRDKVKEWTCLAINLQLSFSRTVQKIVGIFCCLV